MEKNDLLEKDELLLSQLRDCFTAGYTFPQYCVDNNIKRPLFISEKKFLSFIWEIHVQFWCDKGIMPRFAMLDMPDDNINLWLRQGYPLIFNNIAKVNVVHYDKIFLLTTKKTDIKSANIISLDKLVELFNQYVYIEIPALQFLQHYPNVNLFLTKLPNNIARYKGGAEFGKTLTNSLLLAEQIKNSAGEKIKTPLDKFGYSNEDVYELIEPNRGVLTNIDGTTYMKDNPYPLVNIKDSKRTTAYQPETYKNKIYFLGPCHYLGSYAPFDKTIESYLQKMLNEHNLPYRVENEGQNYSGRYRDIFYNLYKLNCKPGDIIFIWLHGGILSDIIPSLNLVDALDPPHDYKDFFVDSGHVNELAYSIIAKKYFEFLTENNFFRDKEFNYPLPPPVSQIWHTALGRAGQRKARNHQQGTGSLQRTA